MAITRGTPTTPGIANSPVVPLPAVVTTNGVLEMRVSNTNNGSATVDTPAGWNKLGNANDGANAGLYVFWKPAFAADSGGSVTLTVSDTAKAYRYSVVQLFDVDRTDPFPHVLTGAMGAAGTSYVTGALTLFAGNPSGKKYLQAIGQAGGFFTHSAHAAAGMTTPTVDEYQDTQGAMGVLLEAAAASATSTFGVTMSASNREAWIISDLREASTGVTGTSAQTLPAFTQTATGTRTVPTSTGSGASVLAAVTQTAAGTRTVPTSTGSGTSSLPAVTQTAAGTRTVPAFTGAAVSSLAPLEQAGSGTHVAPTVTGSADTALPALTQSAAGDVAVPVFTAEAASVLAPFEQTAEGTVATPQTGGTAVSTLPRFTQTAAGEVTPPPVTGTAASVLAAFVQAAEGAVTAPVYSGDGASLLGALTQAATGTAAGPAFTGTAVSLLAAVAQSALGTVAELPCLIVRPTGRTTRVLALTARPTGLTDRPGCD